MIEYIRLQKLLYLDFLIKHKCTGSAKEVARKLRVARSTFFEYKNYLIEEFKAKIKFISEINSYVYIKEPISKSILHFLDSETTERLVNYIEETGSHKGFVL